MSSPSQSAAHEAAEQALAGGAECVCDICNCDLHWCPKHDQRPRVPSDPSAMKSTFARDFPPHATQPRETFKPRESSAPRSDAKMPSRTEARDAFRPQDGVRPAASCKPVADSGAAGMPFIGSTTYSEDFPGWAAAPPGRTAMQPYSPSGIKFDGRTTTASEFRGLPGAPAKPARSTTQGTNALSNPGPLGGQSTYRRDFVPHELATPTMGEGDEAGAPDQAPFRSAPDPRDFRSTYKRDFTPKQNPRKSCPGEHLGAFERGPDGMFYFKRDGLSPGAVRATPRGTRKFVFLRETADGHIMFASAGAKAAAAVAASRPQTPTGAQLPRPPSRHAVRPSTTPAAVGRH